MKADCPKCGGYPEYDEDGGRYTCYFCCDTGRVESEVAEAYYRVEDDYREQFAPRHVSGCWREQRYDEEGPTGSKYRKLFTGLSGMPRVPAPVLVDDGFDDIPF